MQAARLLQKPLKWTCDRSEAFLSDTHGRDLKSTADMAFDPEGRILGYRIRTIANMGACLSNFGPAIATLAPLQVAPGPYHIPAFHQQVTGVYTNSAPVDAYRGAGRPEAAYLLERLIHQGAMDLGLSQDEIRRRNFVRADQMPYKNVTGAIYDSGDFTGNMHDAMARADWAGFATRRQQATEHGLLRGLGMAYYVECTLGDPMEEIDISFDPKAGRVSVSVGTQSNGQGHETAYAQVFADRLGIDPYQVDILQGDSAIKNTGGGTGGSRSLQMIGNACIAAGDSVIERGKEVMAHLYEASPMISALKMDFSSFQAPIAVWEFLNWPMKPPKPICPKLWRGGSICRQAIPNPHPHFPMAAISPRWKSIPKPVLWRSSAIRWWMISEPL